MWSNIKLIDYIKLQKVQIPIFPKRIAPRPGLTTRPDLWTLHLLPISMVMNFTITCDSYIEQDLEVS